MVESNAHLAEFKLVFWKGSLKLRSQNRQKLGI